MIMITFCLDTRIIKKLLNSLIFDSKYSLPLKEFEVIELNFMATKIIIDNTASLCNFKRSIQTALALFHDKRILIVSQRDEIMEEIKHLGFQQTVYLSHICKIPIPDNIKLKIVKEYHEHPLNNHKGINETIRKIKEDHDFPNLNELTAKFVNSCDICIRNKTDRRNTKVPLVIPETPLNINERINVDTAELKAENFKVYILVVQDELSKFCQIYPSKTPVTVNFVRKHIIILHKNIFLGFWFS